MRYELQSSINPSGQLVWNHTSTRGTAFEQYAIEGVAVVAGLWAVVRWAWTVLGRRFPSVTPPRCVECRYDLTGLMPNDRCPECGTEKPRLQPPWWRGGWIGR